MQTIYLDISNKGVIPILYAKQGDVGRKFIAIITDSGKKIDFAENPVFSVWYDGASGDGNYSAIDDRPAVVFDGKKAIVELVAQMLVNHGDGIITLVMNDSRGNQISTWNINYSVEVSIGQGSQTPSQYYTALSETASKAISAAERAERAAKNFEVDKTLTEEGKAADAKSVGVAIEAVDDKAQITDWYLRTISVTPQMFGAVGDGVHDDTMAVRQAIQCSGTVYFPEGTYLITETLGIGDSVRLIGAGVGNGMVLKNGSVASLDGTRIKYTGDGFLFEIRTEYTNPAVIENMSFTGTSTNSFINCDSGSWGACVIVRDFHVRNFEGEWLRLASAFKATFENGTIRSKGKCVMTTYDKKQSTNNFSNCISFHNCYISSLQSTDSNIPVMFELFHVRQLQFTECALERCNVMFKDFVPNPPSEDYNPNAICVADLNLDRCWFEYVGAMYDFQRNSQKPRVTDCRFAKDVLNRSANVAAGELDKLDGTNTGYYRNGETSSIESAIRGEQTVYSSAMIVNDTDAYDSYFYPYIIASNRAMFNVPVNTQTVESTDGKTVAFNVRSLARASKVSGHYKVLIFVHYGSGNRNVWEAEVFSYASASAKTYMLIKKEKILSEGTGPAATATETLTSSNGELTFTTSEQAVKLAMIVEYNFNHLTSI